MKAWPIALAAILAVPALAATSDEAPEQVVRLDRYHIDYVLNEDGSNTRTYDWARTVLQEKALEATKRASVSHSTSVEKVEILEAYTRKANGQRLDVPQSNYQITVNRGAQDGSPAFSDRTSVTVVFPDVAVGDTTVFKYRVDQAEAIFPGHFSVTDTYAKMLVYKDVRVRVDAPASMKARYEGRGMKQRTGKGKGRQWVEWTWRNLEPTRTKRRDWSVYDIEGEVGYTYSTFDSYAAIAAAYAARARPKAAVTGRVSKLADEIVGKRTDPREQARALYDWVATKIGYAGNCIGVGVVVPRDLDFILDNKMGDCKDHATLLQALLSAKGIPSTQALINAGSVYRLPKIPVVSTVNHVINYIPQWDLYLDSTSSTTPFGMLPFAVSDKPVLLTDAHKDGQRTPSTPIGSNAQHMKTVVDVKSDGSIEATMEVAQKGVFAANSRDWAREFPKDQEKDLVKNVFQSDGQVASGTLQKDDPTELLDRYNFSLKMQVQDYIHRPGAGAFNIAPLFGTEAPVARYVWSAMDHEETTDVACSNGTATEEYVYTFPADMQILSVPDDFEIANDFLSYQATYKLEGRKLTVFRKFDDRTKGNTCSPALMAQYKALTEKVIPNMRAQVLYK
jgi:transglutaminase-like putative cysteine protease